MAKDKTIDFTEARKSLSGILDQVQKTGQVTILRHGKPTAVVVSHKEYVAMEGKKRPWKLAGSLKFRKGVDIDKALQELSDRNIQSRRLSLERSMKEFGKD